jgi:hypothetical protein
MRANGIDHDPLAADDENLPVVRRCEGRYVLHADEMSVANRAKA